MERQSGIYLFVYLNLNFPFSVESIVPVAVLPRRKDLQYSVCAVKQNMICWICHLISLQKLCKNGFVHVKVFNIKGTRHEVFKNFISKDKEIKIWACILTCLKFVSNCESAV